MTNTGRLKHSRVICITKHLLRQKHIVSPRQDCQQMLSAAQRVPNRVLSGQNSNQKGGVSEFAVSPNEKCLWVGYIRKLTGNEQESKT